jgi:hypothetical protein
MYKIAKNEIFEPLIGHGPHWINLTIFTLISENNRYFKCPYTIWSKLFHLTFFFKRKFQTIHRFYEKKGEFEILRMSLHVSNRYLDCP